jgi:hypothetical protein
MLQIGGHIKKKGGRLEISNWSLVRVQSPSSFFLNKIRILNKIDFWTNFESEQIWNLNKNFKWEQKIGFEHILNLKKNWIWTNLEYEQKIRIWTKKIECEQILNVNKIWIVKKIRICSDLKNKKGKRKNRKKEHWSPTRSDSHTCDWSLVRETPVF